MFLFKNKIPIQTKIMSSFNFFNLKNFISFYYLLTQHVSKNNCWVYELASRGCGIAWIGHGIAWCRRGIAWRGRGIVWQPRKFFKKKKKKRRHLDQNLDVNPGTFASNSLIICYFSKPIEYILLFVCFFSVRGKCCANTQFEMENFLPRIKTLFESKDFQTMVNFFHLFFLFQGSKFFCTVKRKLHLPQGVLFVIFEFCDEMNLSENLEINVTSVTEQGNIFNYQFLNTSITPPPFASTNQGAELKIPYQGYHQRYRPPCPIFWQKRREYLSKYCLLKNFLNKIIFRRMVPGLEGATVPFKGTSSCGKKTLFFFSFFRIVQKNLKKCYFVHI